MILDLQPEEIKRKLGYYNKQDKLCVFLRKKRREEEYTLRKFAAELGISGYEYTKLEKGDESPNLEEMVTISELLNIDFTILSAAFIARAMNEPINILEE